MVHNAHASVLRHPVQAGGQPASLLCLVCCGRNVITEPRGLLVRTAWLRTTSDKVPLARQPGTANSSRLGLHAKSLQDPTLTLANRISVLWHQPGSILRHGACVFVSVCVCVCVCVRGPASLDRTRPSHDTHTLGAFAVRFRC